MNFYFLFFSNTIWLSMSYKFLTNLFSETNAIYLIIKIYFYKHFNNLLINYFWKFQNLLLVMIKSFNKSYFTIIFISCKLCKIKKLFVEFWNFLNYMIIFSELDYIRNRLEIMIKFFLSLIFFRYSIYAFDLHMLLKKINKLWYIVSAFENNS